MKIAIGGDMSITEASSPLFASMDAKGTFGDVLDHFAACDRVIVNLECALTESENGIKKFGPCLKAPLASADTLKKAGVTDCALSNNHIFDFGIKGLLDTMRELDRVGINYTGIGKNKDDARKPFIIVKDGITVAIINVCEHEYSYATAERIGAWAFDPFETMEDIRNAKKSADYVIVIYHGGKEHCQYPSPRLMSACREMVRCGADTVLCQHSHCIGCYEKFENAHILYGQGNFHFVGFRDHPNWESGLLAILDIEKTGIDISFIPCVMTKCGIDTAKGTKADEILTALWQRSETLHDGTWQNHWHAFCESVLPNYKRAICDYKFEDDLDATQRFAHYLDCEAHQGVWRELFPTWNMTNELDK